jgi:hypothetical protein
MLTSRLMLQFSLSFSHLLQVYMIGHGLMVMVNTRNLVDMLVVNNRGQYGLGIVLQHVCSVFVLV